MARAEIDRAVQPSLLERLIDEAPGAAADPPIGRAESVRAFKDAVRRDLERLLNTRRIAEPAAEQFEEVRHSVYHYGLPDITSLSRDSSESRVWLMRQVEEAVALYEPRLSGVHVELVEVQGESHRKEMHFLVRGMLRLDPTPERVLFDTVLEVASGEYEVRAVAARAAAGG